VRLDDHWGAEKTLRESRVSVRSKFCRKVSEPRDYTSITNLSTAEITRYTDKVAILCYCKGTLELLQLAGKSVYF
jgi:hypothetical protein